MNKDDAKGRITAILKYIRDITEQEEFIPWALLEQKLFDVINGIDIEENDIARQILERK